jgi:leader peptidase (prepilin peptidase)/N-methyltransferase
MSEGAIETRLKVVVKGVFQMGYVERSGMVEADDTFRLGCGVLADYFTPGGPLAFRRGVVAVLTIFAVMGVIGSSWSPVSWVITLSIPPLVWAAWVDLHTFRLPNVLTLAAAVPPLTFSVAAGAVVDPMVMVQVLTGVAVLVVPLGAIHLVSPASMGLGDVKVCVGIGGCLGMIDPRLGVAALSVASVVTAAAGLMTRTRVLPFGPGLVAGALITLTVAAATSMEAQQW